MRKYISTIGLCLLCSGFSAVVNAQQLNLNKGDEYKVTTVMSSTTQMKRGDKQLDFSGMSSLTKSYKVTDATDNGYKLAITATNIADTINAFNQKLAYNTNRAADPASSIETALSKMVGENQTVSLDKSGKITQVADLSQAMRHAETADMSGIYNHDLIIGGTLNLGSDFKLPAGSKNGTTWTENKKVGDVNTKTTFKVEETTAAGTKISFQAEQTEPGTNSNINGLMIMENATGVILQRILKINSMSNQSQDGKEFMTSKKKIISEVAEKVK